MRKNSNSEILADEFAKGAVEAGHKIEKLSLADKTIGFCKGCLSCQKTHQCIIKDDANIIAEKIKNADVVVFATPIYYYEMSGQMKTLLDRCNPIFPADYAFRDIYLIAAAADYDNCAMDGAIKGLKGFITCFEKSRLAGVVCGTGANGAGEIKANGKAMKSAYDMGKNA